MPSQGMAFGQGGVVELAQKLHAELPALTRCERRFVTVVKATSSSMPSFAASATQACAASVA